MGKLIQFTFASLVLGLTACPSDPKPKPPTDTRESCLNCHEGIEQAHGSIDPGSCTVCHGGDPEAEEKADAHIPIPEDWATIRGDGLPAAPEGFIKDFSPDQLDALDPDYLRFLNPGDIRVVDQTCGPCHPDETAKMGSSIMTTNAGHYYPTLYLAGLQESRDALYGSYPASDPDCDPSIPGTVCSLETLVPPGAEEVTDVVTSGDIATLEGVAYEHYLAKNCNTCHQAGYPRNNSPGLYRSTGCTSCHMVYDEQGVYAGGDPTITKGSPVHPLKHEITKAIPTEQCATCHFQGGRIGLLYRGIREGGFGAGSAPPNAEPINRTLYGHAPPYYYTDEDTTNSIDETPPDLHYAAGMHCADCHVGSDVHGDGRIYSSSKFQVDLRCEDCHGSVRDAIAEDGEGTFRTSKGRALSQLSRAEDGRVVLTGIVDGAEHTVPQVADLLAPGGGATAAMHAAMGPDGEGWSHTDSLTCDTCHTSYNQLCIGCHVSYDLRLDQVDYQTGQLNPGLTRGSRSSYSLSQILLGTAPDGRVQTVHSSQQVQMAIKGATKYGSASDGEIHLGAENGEGKLIGEFRHRDGLEANNGFVPFFQHTTSRVPRTCTSCHRRDESDEETARIRGVYGYGTGEFMLETPEGELVDGLQFLEEDGTPRTTWVHPNTGPVSTEAYQRAFDVLIDP